MTMQEARKELKALGFGVSVKQSCFGKRCATYWRKDGDGNKHELAFNCATAEQWAPWKPLLEWRDKNHAALLDLQKEEQCFGLVK